MTLTRPLGDVVFHPAQVDPDELARAIEHELKQEPLDFRTRLLIRDSVEALTRYWGPARVESWLESLPQRSRIDMILRSEALGEPGFPSLARRISTSMSMTLRSKLFSPRERDRDDLRVLVRRLDRAALTQRLETSTGSFMADPALRAHAEKNWYIIYGDQLPA